MRRFRARVAASSSSGRCVRSCWVKVRRARDRSLAASIASFDGFASRHQWTSEKSIAQNGTAVIWFQTAAIASL